MAEPKPAGTVEKRDLYEVAALRPSACSELPTGPALDAKSLAAAGLPTRHVAACSELPTRAAMDAQLWAVGQVLGLFPAATPEQIKHAYKKAALRYHPDKAARHQARHDAEGAAEAARRFQEISAAYSVLSDPAKKARYDARGFQGLEPSELDAEIDVSSLGLFGTVAAAMFSKLGVPIRTSIAASVLEAAYEGRFSVERLGFGQTLSSKVDKAQAVFFELEVSQADIDAGFVVGAHSAAGSKFKLLLFERTGGSWELQAQEDSMRAKGASLATLFFPAEGSYSVGPRPMLEAAKQPDAQLFMRLDSLAPRESLAVKPGVLLLAVYGDNWFKRAHFSITAVQPAAQRSRSAALADVRSLESKLLEQQGAIRAFEAEYRQAERQWKAACEKFAALSSTVEDTLRQREESYLRLIGGDGPAGSGGSEVGAFQPLWQGWAGLRARPPA